MRTAWLALLFLGCGSSTDATVTDGGDNSAGADAADPPPTHVYEGPLLGKRDQLTIAVIGDYGVDNEDQARVAAMVHAWKPDHVLTTGDNNYPSGELATFDQNVGKHWHSYIAGYTGMFGDGAAENRFWPSPGNHDWKTPRLEGYLAFFKPPSKPANGRYYEVDFGILHAFLLDSDSNEPDGILDSTPQAKWAHGAIANSRSCFDLVLFHHPPYSSGSHGSTSYMRWPFRAWGADAVLAGHEHLYERLEVDSIPYFINGFGGAGAYEFKSVLPESRVRYNAKHGAMLIKADRTGITYEFHAAGVEPSLVDRLRVDRSCP